MTEKLKPAKPPVTAEERKHWGEIPKGPERYPDSLGKKVGGWLTGLLTAWKR